MIAINLLFDMMQSTDFTAYQGRGLSLVLTPGHRFRGQIVSGRWSEMPITCHSDGVAWGVP